MKIFEIKNSINICIRKRNNKYINFYCTNYLRDGNVLNFKTVIKYLLKNYNYKLFITGDVDELDIKHKNLYNYKKFSKKISREFYQLSIQTLSKFHIMNSGGGNSIVRFNNGCKTLYIDCWPPINFQQNSIVNLQKIYFL